MVYCEMCFSEIGSNYVKIELEDGSHYFCSSNCVSDAIDEMEIVMRRDQSTLEALEKALQSLEDSK